MSFHPNAVAGCCVQIALKAAVGADLLFLSARNWCGVEYDVRKLTGEHPDSRVVVDEFPVVRYACGSPAPKVDGLFGVVCVFVASANGAAFLMEAAAAGLFEFGWRWEEVVQILGHKVVIKCTVPPMLVGAANVRWKSASTHWAVV